MTPQQRQLRDEWRMAIGKAIKGLRDQEGMTQQQLADQSGIDRTTIVHLERGQRSILLDRLLPLLTALSTRPSDLIEMIDFDYDWEQRRRQSAAD